MDTALSNIPPEAWPWIDLIFNLTCAAAGLWLAVTVFVIWRRNASNLTPVSSVPTNKRAQPDFLKVNEKARREAIARGEDFDKELEKRDRDEAAALRKAARRRQSPLQRITSLISLFLAVSSLLSVIVSVIWQVGTFSRVVEQYSASDRLLAIIADHPIGVTVAALIIALHIFRFINDRKWQQEA